QLTQRPSNLPPPSRTNENKPLVATPNHPSDLADQQGPPGAGQVELGSGAPTRPQTVLLGHSVPEPALDPQLGDKAETLTVPQQPERTNQLLSGNEELLRDIRRAL
ncbi:hypothetical protein FRC11_001003, partial [Ceratobasidium sp. 423]